MTMVVAGAATEFFEMAGSAEGGGVVAVLVIGGIIAFILGRN
jgi:hypothetical protein